MKGLKRLGLVLAVVVLTPVSAEPPNVEEALQACEQKCSEQWDACVTKCQPADNVCMSACDAESDRCSEPCVKAGEAQIERIPLGRSDPE